MSRTLDLPSSLGRCFSVARARTTGVGYDRLRNPALEAPSHATRLVREPFDAASHPLEQRRQRELLLIRTLAQRLTEAQFVSHRSAALLWGAPMPQLHAAELHLSVLSPGRAPRVAGVIGHRVDPQRCRVEQRDGIALSSAAATWVMLGSLGLSVTQLVVAGDYLIRMHRHGYGRPRAGEPPLTTRDELWALLELGRWAGQPRLEQAVERLREDSWSPQETILRLNLESAGLPVPELNVDIFGSDGRFLGCLDLAYRELKVGVEYHGVIHADRYAHDVERMAALRDDGWIIIEVTKVGGAASAETVRRVAKALRSRGWAN